jgi:hypothetical protein
MLRLRGLVQESCVLPRRFAEQEPEAGDLGSSDVEWCVITVTQREVSHGSLRMRCGARDLLSD